MVSRWLNRINPEMKLLPDFLLSHISDFTRKFNIVTITAILIIIFGMVYECFIPILNTPDIWDAIFVAAGTAVAYIYLVILKKNGLIEQ